MVRYQKNLMREILYLSFKGSKKNAKYRKKLNRYLSRSGYVEVEKYKRYNESIVDLKDLLDKAIPIDFSDLAHSTPWINRPIVLAI